MILSFVKCFDGNTQEAETERESVFRESVLVGTCSLSEPLKKPLEPPERGLIHPRPHSRF